MKIFFTIITSFIILSLCNISPLSANEQKTNIETIESCLERAHRDNLTIKESFSGMKIQKLQRAKAKTKSYITLKGDVQFSTATYDNDNSANTSKCTDDHSIYLNQPLYYFGSNKNSYMYENALYHKDRLNFLQTIMNTERDIRIIYIDILKASRKLAFQKNCKEFILKYIEDNGGSQQEKFNKLGVFIEQINSDISENETILKNAIEHLNTELYTDEFDQNTQFITFGTIESYETSDYFNTQNNDDESDIADIALKYASTRSPEWLMQDYDIEASEYNLKKAKSDLLPKIDARASLERSEGDDSSIWTLGIYGGIKFISPEDWKEVEIKKEELNKTKISKDNFYNKRAYQIKSSIQDLFNNHKQISLNTKKTIIASSYLSTSLEENIEDPMRISDMFETYYNNCSSRIDSIYSYLKIESELAALIGCSIYLNNPSLLQFAEEMNSNSKIVDYTKDSYYDSKAIHKMRELIKKEDIAGAEKMLNKLNQESDAPIAGGWTPLHFFAYWNKPNAIRKIAQTNPNAINKRSEDGSTPLYMAVTKGNKEAVRELLNAGADISLTGEYWAWSPLEKAANRGFYEICEMLIDKGADINTKSKIGKNAFHKAIQQGHFDIVKLFVEKGADINALTSDNMTPKQLAQTEGYINIYQYLKGLEKNGEIHNNNGKSNSNGSEKAENNTGRTES